ncbi:hypothetical protein AHAS_Ahas15G0165200 [Arachis hypogaea]
MMRVATSIGWTGSQKSWSCLLEQIMEIGRHGSLAFSLPIPQQVVFISVNPENGTYELLKMRHGDQI